MSPCELNAIIMALTNHFYDTLSEKDFDCLTIFLSELSKSMFAMALFRRICDHTNGKHHEKPKEK